MVHSRAALARPLSLRVLPPVLRGGSPHSYTPNSRRLGLLKLEATVVARSSLWGEGDVGGQRRSQQDAVEGSFLRAGNNDLILAS